jgi:hypothetical protein
LPGEPNAPLSLLAHVLAVFTVSSASIDRFIYAHVIDSALTWVNLSV